MERKYVHPEVGRQHEMVRSTSRMEREHPHTIWGWADHVKCSGRLHRESNHQATTYKLWAKDIPSVRPHRMTETNIHSEDGQKTWIGQVDFAGQKPTTYILRMGRRREMISQTSQKDRDQPHTFWEWADNVKWSVRLHRRTETNHIQSEDGGQCEMIRLTSQKDGDQPRTFWGWADDVKWSGRLHRRMGTNHLQAEDGRWCEMIRLTSRKDGGQPRTNWGCADDKTWSGRLHGWRITTYSLDEKIVKWSGWLHWRMENYYTLSGYGGMALPNIEFDHLGALAMITYSLMFKSHCQNVQSIS